MEFTSQPRRLSNAFLTALTTTLTLLSACGGGSGANVSPDAGASFSFSEQPAATEADREFATALSTTTTTVATYWSMKSTMPTTSQVGRAYTQANVASGGVLPYRYTLALGTLPTGTKLDSTTGTVSGTPTAAGTYGYSIRATDAAGKTRRNDLSVKVAPSPVISDTSSSTSVLTSDVLYNFSASNMDSYKYATLQCQGTRHYFWQWGSQSAYYSNPLPNPVYGTYNGASFQAFSTVPSPGETGKQAFMWDVRRTDPDTSGTNSKRCEFALGWREFSYPGKVLSYQHGLPANKDNWWAVAVRQEDWSAVGTNNDWQILWQWHDAYGNDLPPFLTLQGKGNTWQIMLAYDMNTNPTNSTLKKVIPWTGQINPNTWYRFVVKARKDLVNPSNGYVQVWMNGTQIVNYRGPFGYNVTQMDYAKVGIYKWVSTANTWSSTLPARRMWSKGPVQVNNRSGYTWQSIDALLD